MEELEKKLKKLDRLKWLGPAAGIIVYMATYGVFPHWISLALCFFFTVGFVRICRKEKKRLLCDDIVDDLRKTLKTAGHIEAIFELKQLQIGIVVRVYLIKAGSRSAACSKAVVDRIMSSWYQSYVCATQIVDIEGKTELKDAQAILNAGLVEELKKRASKGRDKDK